MFVQILHINLLYIEWHLPHLPGRGFGSVFCEANHLSGLPQCVWTPCSIRRLVRSTSLPLVNLFKEYIKIASYNRVPNFFTFSMVTTRNRRRLVSYILNQYLMKCVDWYMKISIYFQMIHPPMLGVKKYPGLLSVQWGGGKGVVVHQGSVLCPLLFTWFRRLILWTR